MEKDQEFKRLILERFDKLPRVVQEAIVSADVSRRMQELAEKHKLHLDQWESLENEVQYTLLGIQEPAELSAHIEKGVRVSRETATALASDISEMVFEPIRLELEKELKRQGAVTPAEVAKGETPVPSEAPRNTPQAVSALQEPMQAQTPVVPATPPKEAQQSKVVREPLSTVYAPKQPSHERKSVEGDPYREPIS